MFLEMLLPGVLYQMDKYDGEKEEEMCAISNQRCEFSSTKHFSRTNTLLNGLNTNEAFFHVEYA